MDKIDVLMILFFTVFIGWSVKDIGNLIVPAKKRRIEIVAVLVGLIVLLVIALLYAKTWLHYIVFVLGVIFFILMVTRVGMTPKGFNSMKGMFKINWDKISSVEVSFKNNTIKVEIFASFLRWDYQYYKKEDYDKIIGLLYENLPRERVRLKQRCKYE